MSEKKDIPATRAHIHKGSVLPASPAKIPAPAVKPTEGARPNPPTKSK